jgi:MerR family redox-sensitive transcriptional activator SoxR
MATAAKLEIGAVARQVGLAPSALRYYEAMGLLPAPRRVGKRRQYDASVFARLAMIQFAQQAGFTVAEMRVLLAGFAPGTTYTARWQSLAERKLPQVEALIERATEMKRLLESSLRCGCLTLESCPLLQDALGGQRAEAETEYVDNGRAG